VFDHVHHYYTIVKPTLQRYARLMDNAISDKERGYWADALVVACRDFAVIHRMPCRTLLAYCTGLEWDTLL